MSTIASLDSSVYYKEQYWDSFPQAKAYIQRQATGHANWDSLQHFKHAYGKKPFKHGLFLNCGNGWLERWFIKHGLVKKATAFDYSPELIAEAQKKQKKLPISYFQTDANTIVLPENTYDLVVNSAALHHVQYLNRLCYQILRAMKPHGVFFHYDYIGPHRNQYSVNHWHSITSVNDALPTKIRKQPLTYPHLPTMMVTDPSEAVHSELIPEVVSRYFGTISRHDISGMIAYNILSLNPKLKKGQKSPEIQRVLDQDQAAYKRGEVPPLFTYWLTKPRKEILLEAKKIALWQLEENWREKLANLIEHTYSPQEYWQLVRHSQKGARILKLIGFLLLQPIVSGYLILRRYL